MAEKIKNLCLVFNIRTIFERSYYLVIVIIIYFNYLFI